VSDDVASATPVLEVQGLTKSFRARGGLLPGVLSPRRYISAVDNVSFGVGSGESFGLVGESGCGKSTTARLITRLIPPDRGSVRLNGTDVTKLSEAALRPWRRHMQIIFQNPYASLDPRMTVEQIVAEPIVTHHLVPNKQVRERVRELLHAVGLNPYHAGRYPHQFSGGQRQRIGFARALAAGPQLLVADEPVSALDVSIQAQIIGLVQDLQEQFRLSLLFISHNLAVVKYLCSRVGVMYLGRLVEVGPTAEVLERPRHPYTRALLSAVLEPSVKQSRERIILQGDVPSPVNAPAACRFHTRCPYAEQVCREQDPAWTEVGDGHRVACHLVAQGRL
jgi:peptide/nickel transport system ATP-binding protein/oligopeptide transport system ATP-binding protein